MGREKGRVRRGLEKRGGRGNDGGFLARFGDGDNIAVVLF